MSTDGELTAAIAERLAKELDPKGYAVFHDHVPALPNFKKTYSWFGPGGRPTQETRLSQPDIVVLEQSTGRVVVLVELEETKDQPKTLLGDAFGLLLGEHVAFRREPDMQLGDWTTLVVMGKGKHKERDAFLTQQVNACLAVFNTPKIRIGRVQISSFGTAADTERELRTAVYGALRMEPPQ